MNYTKPVIEKISTFKSGTSELRYKWFNYC